MLGALLQLMIPAIALAIERDGTQRDQPVLEEQHDIGPLMTHDTSLAMMKCLGVFRMQTRAMLERTRGLCSSGAESRASAFSLVNR